MDRKERIQRYKDGETIASIAKGAGVSHQAITALMHREGIHKANVGGRPKAIPSVIEWKQDGPTDSKTRLDFLKDDELGQRSELTDEGICNVLNGIVRQADFVVGGDKEEKLYTNVYISSKGCRVFDMKKSGWATYKTFALLSAAYS